MAAIQVQVRIPEELMQRMEAYIADTAGAFMPSRSEVVRRLIEEGLAAQEAAKGTRSTSKRRGR